MSDLRTFMGCSYEQARKAFGDALETLGVDGGWTGLSNSFLLGSQNRSEVFLCKAPSLRIELQKATTDPLSRFFGGFVSSHDRYESLVFVHIRPVGRETAPLIQEVLREMCKGIDRNPWEVSHHPRMKNAWLMRLRIKRQWRRWLGESG